MKRLITCVVGILMGSSMLSEALTADQPHPGEALPSFVLSVPGNEAQKAYLGLSGGGSFKIAQIKARIVIIEIFSMYCPHCQREAPMVNRLYEKIENNLSLKGKIKLIGIGVGNSPFEVNVFRKRYHIPFPLFPDIDFVIHKAFGEARTPCFVGVQLDENGNDQVVYSKVGDLGNMDYFLHSICKGSGIDQEL